MHSFLVDMLICPACHGPLRWTVHRQTEGDIEEAEAACSACDTSYPVDDGIGVFLVRDLQREDLWTEVETGLGRYLRENPQVEADLLSAPIDSLNPADQFFRALALEGKGDFPRSREAERLSHEGSYTPAYRDCWNREVEELLTRLEATRAPVFDLASGRCALVLRMLPRVHAPVVATDISPQVMRRNRALLRSMGQHTRVSLLVLDARQTPFADGSIESLTTNLGLPNVRDSAGLAREIRRILSGTFLAVSHFYPPSDANARAIADAGLADPLDREATLSVLRASGLSVEILNPCRGAAAPTPAGELIRGARIDALPVAETELHWSVLRAT